MQIHDTRGEIYRNWLIVLLNLRERYFYELHSPEGYINQNLYPFEHPQAAIASARKDIDGVIQLFDEADGNAGKTFDINASMDSASTGGEKK